jgi:hypothetical protein
MEPAWDLFLSGEKPYKRNPLSCSSKFYTTLEIFTISQATLNNSNMYYQPPHQTPEDDLVDERWDTDLGFYPSESSLKEQPAETQYKSISYNDGKKQVRSAKNDKESTLNIFISSLHHVLYLQTLLKRSMI